MIWTSTTAVAVMVATRLSCTLGDCGQHISGFHLDITEQVPNHLLNTEQQLEPGIQDQSFSHFCHQKGWYNHISFLAQENCSRPAQICPFEARTLDAAASVDFSQAKQSQLRQLCLQCQQLLPSAGYLGFSPCVHALAVIITFRMFRFPSSEHSGGTCCPGKCVKVTENAHWACNFLPENNDSCECTTCRDTKHQCYAGAVCGKVSSPALTSTHRCLP